MIVDLKALSAIDFIKFNLKKIEIAKDMFVKEIEHGEEVFLAALGYADTKYTEYLFESK